MILQSFLIFVPALLAGVGLVHLLWRNDGPWALALKICLGAGLGIGITSCIYFIKLILFSSQGGYLFIQVAFLIVVLIGLFSQKRISLPILLNGRSFTGYQLLLGLAAVLVAISTLYYSVDFARLAPHGDYDAQAIWNLRARSVYRLGDAWEQAFSPLINRNFHMDYPLLIPLSVVGGWNTLNREVLRVPAVVSILFLFGLAGILYTTTAYLRSSSQAALVLILLLATPSLLLYSTFQTADVPLTFFFAGSVSLFILGANERNQSLLFLSGLTAGLAAWTKNEGIPFVLIMLFCALLVFGFRHTLTKFLLAGMAFPLATVILFKILVSANNDLFTQNPLYEIVSKLLDPARYLQILEHLISELFRLGEWPISIIVVLLAYGAIMGVRKSSTLAEKGSLLIPILQFLAYIFIYVITPRDLEWHLNYSMSRLLMHIFPLVLLSFFLLVNTPETVLRK
jgi:4-amino-4-deoxy-L-arabinose transferase-like glycosyltransferase